MDIRQIISNNLILLRKKHNLTQIELAEKLNYSDNAISRWERMEVLPSLETLEKISELFNVSLASLISVNSKELSEKEHKKLIANRLATCLIYVSLIILVATVIFVYARIKLGEVLWEVFVWSVPCICLVIMPLNTVFGKHIFKFVIFSVFLWTFIASIFLQFLDLNMFMIFFIGIPIQGALAIWTFVKPKKK